MPFRFPLAAVLRIREEVEEHERRKLERIQQEITLHSRAIERLAAQSRELLAARGRELTRPGIAYDLHASEAQRKALEDEKEHLVSCLQKLITDSERQIEVYRAARRDREMLTEIRDRQLAAYDVKRTRQDQRALDDVFISRQKRS